MTVSEAVQRYLPPLTKPKQPVVAATIGVLLGGVGLALYFWSLRDLLPLEVLGVLVIVGSAITGVHPVDALNVVGLPVAILGGSYGYWRAESSNRRLTASGLAGGVVGSAG
jgi:hypothetical protein